jgi:hypothetical protein
MLFFRLSCGAAFGLEVRLKKIIGAVIMPHSPSKEEIWRNIFAVNNTTYSWVQEYPLPAARILSMSLFFCLITLGI